MVLGLVLFTAACTEYTDQIWDLESFMNDLKFIDAKYDIDQIEKEVMEQRIFDNLGIFLGDKSTTYEKIDAFVESVKKIQVSMDSFSSPTNSETHTTVF